MKKFIVFIITLMLSSTAYGFSADFSWDANQETDLVGYKMYMSTTNVYPFDLVGTTPTVGFTVPNLSTSVAYYFAVTAYNLTAESEYSNIVYFMVPTSPTGVQVILNSLTVNGINKITIRP